MGATESLFYDEDPPIDQEQPHSFPASYTDPHDTRNRLSYGGPRVARRAKQRTRPRPGGGNDLPFKTMDGLVLGLQSSGKTTLLERLKGKDPFEDPQLEENAAMGDSSPRKSNAMAVVPYQAPPGSSVWDRLQMKVQTSLEVTLDSNVNFAVILINPHHDPSQIQAYLIKVITDLLKLYEKTVQDWRSNKALNQPSLPLCMCFMVNFRDHYNKKNRGIQESDVKQCVHSILQHAERLPNQDQLLLEFGTTSLFNCYGLATLHHFIYAAYLRSKRNELEQELHHVQAQLSKPNEAPRMKYKDFLKIVNDSNAADREEKDKQVLESARRETNGSQYIQNGQRNGSAQDQDKSEEESRTHMQQMQGRRKILGNEETVDAPKPAPVPSAYENSKQALEDFLASDDEDEEPAVKTREERAAYISMNSMNSDDDYDDDFFYDEAGERCIAHIGKPAKSAGSTNRKLKSSSAVQASPKLNATEIRRDQSSVISESTDESHDDRGVAGVKQVSTDRSNIEPKVEPTPDTNMAIEASQAAETPPQVAIADGEKDAEDLEERDKNSQHEDKRQSPEDTRTGLKSSRTSSCETEKQVQDQECHDKSNKADVGDCGNAEKGDAAESKEPTNETDIESKASGDNEQKSIEASGEVDDGKSVSKVVEIQSEEVTEDGDQNMPADISDAQNAAAHPDKDKIADQSGTKSETNQADLEDEDPDVQDDIDATIDAVGAENKNKTTSYSDSEDEDEFFIGENTGEDIIEGDDGEKHVHPHGKGETSHDNTGDASDNAAHESTAAAPSKQDAGDDSDDENEFFIGESDMGDQEEVVDNTESSQMARETAAEPEDKELVDTEVTRMESESSDKPSADDEPGEKQEGGVTPAQNKNEEVVVEASAPSEAPQPTGNSSLSAAAKAAIAAAQKEAELMVQQSIAPAKSDRAEKKAKKKEQKKKAKEMKKEKKAKRKDKAEDDV